MGQELFSKLFKHPLNPGELIEEIQEGMSLSNWRGREDFIYRRLSDLPYEARKTAN
jgi:hypothetical protein